MKKLILLAGSAALALILCRCADEPQGPVTLSDDALYTEFEDPGHEWRGKPFWSWNGRLEKDELIRQLHVFKEMGMGGAFMHSRIGLKSEYLGPEWFELTNAVADEAEKIGMEAYLYDEDRWPSGSAGGMVTEDPKYRQNHVRLYTMPAEEFVWDSDSIVSAFACRLDGIEYSEAERLTKDADMSKYAGKTVLKFRLETAPCNDNYNGYTYLDPMSREATDRYIELTHEAYKAHCGERIGTNIVGIFTDEPHRGNLFGNAGGGADSGANSVPWTPTMLDEYKKAFGGDLAAELPRLFLRENGERVNDTKWKYCELTQRLFLKNFAEPQFDWCTKNDMIYTGHILHENTFSNQVSVVGSVMRYYEYMHTPGVDMLTENDNSYWVVKQLSSVARQLGQKWLLSELYGCTGWQFDFESHKAVGDWQALFGINLRCHHLSWYTMEGEAKRDYPASIFFQSPWWKEYKYVEDYFSRLGVMLNQGSPVCDVLVVNPVESVWSQVCVTSFNHLYCADPIIGAMEARYADLFHWLAGERIDFDYGDEEMMSRMSGIGKDEAGNPVFEVGQAAYRTVLVGNMETMRRSTLDALEKFEKAGGKIIFMGEAPRYVDVAPSDAPARMAENNIHVDYAQAPVVAAVKEAIRPVVQVADASGRNIAKVFGQVRRDDDRHYVVLMNMDRQNGFDSVTVTLPFEGEVALWDCKTGEVFAQPAETAEGRTIIRTAFEPVEEKVYTISASTPAFARPAQVFAEQSTVELPDTYEYTLDEPNICVLDLATWQIGDGATQPLTEILKIDRAVRKHFGLRYRGGEMLQPWFAEKHDKDAYTKPLGIIKMNFPFDIAVMPSDTVFLCMETPARFAVLINGKRLKDPVPQGWFIDNSIRRIAIPAGYLKQGANEITLTSHFSRDLDLEALYLTGNFGVDLKGIRRTLTKLPARLKAGDITSQGLPFYSGAVCYRIGNLPKPAEGERMFIEMDGFDGGCIELNNDYAHRICGWQPYRLDVTDVAAQGDTVLLNVVLTRRNTFGPLHALPALVGAYGPGNWITEGPSFTMDAYALLPSGLTHRPSLVVEKAVQTAVE